MTTVHLGQGRFGCVQLVEYLGTHVAKKVFSDRASFMRERAVWLHVTAAHPNLVSLCQNDGHANGDLELCFEYVAGENLYSLVERHAPLDEHMSATVLTQACGGLLHLHHMGIAHMDVKLENLMCNDAGLVKVIDLGLAEVYPRLMSGHIDFAHRVRTIVGSPPYMAPEIMREHAYDAFLCDVYSLGVCLVAMRTGHLVFTAARQGMSQYDAALHLPRETMLQTLYSADPAVRALTRGELAVMNGALCLDPACRISMLQFDARARRLYESVAPHRVRGRGGLRHSPRQGLDAPEGRAGSWNVVAAHLAAV